MNSTSRTELNTSTSSGSTEIRPPVYLIGFPNTEAAWTRMARAASAADMTIHEWISFLTGIRVVLVPLAESIIVNPARQLPAPKGE